MFRYPVDEAIELRLLELRHAPLVFALVQENRDYLAEWLPWAHEEPALEKTEAFIRHQLERFIAGQALPTGIWYQGTLVGLISFNQIATNDKWAEIGYWLAEPYQGRGIVTRACQALVRYAFQELGLNRVQIRVAVDNARSRAIPERLGFTQEGILRQAARVGDRFMDMVMYSILAEEWRPDDGDD